MPIGPLINQEFALSFSGPPWITSSDEVSVAMGAAEVSVAKLGVVEV